MEDVVERIRELCKKNETSITKLEKKLGYANGTIGKWKNAKKAPPLEKVIAVSKELKVSSDYILTGVDPGHGEIKSAPDDGGGLSAEHQKLLELFDACNDNQKRLLLEMAQMMSEKKGE